jgi:hypothetical protein
MLFIGPDLQGSRYLYLGSSMWSVAVVAMVNPRTATAPGRVPALILGGLALVSVMATLMHQGPWLEAAATRERVLKAAEELTSNCHSVVATELPDNVDGAYVFRNGFIEAFSSLPLQASGVERCRVRWTGEFFQRIAP